MTVVGNIYGLIALAPGVALGTRSAAAQAEDRLIGMLLNDRV